MASTHVITICSRRHEDVWRLTSELLPRYVKADQYKVYVPESEMSFFSSITPPVFQVNSQESLSQKYLEPLTQRLVESGNPERLGWYAQQFHKIEALRVSDGNFLVIWDADCVPVSEIQLFSSGGEPIYMGSTEHHEPYFAAIEKLTGLSSRHHSSFVIPGFPITAEMMASFISAIETNHQVPWYEAIMDSTDFSLASGFSETETLGTWVMSRSKESLITSEVTWERYGTHRFGYARHFTPQRLVALARAKGLQIVSFENWNEPHWTVRFRTALIGSIRNFIKKYFTQKPL